MADKINYTIIIPHKNTPDLLQRCLDSIPKRPDVQVIIVDDNSNPEKVDFSAFPGHLDENTRIIFSKSGKGAGASRNMALKYVTGKWVFFADADDFFNSCFLKAADRYIASDADVVYFSVNSKYSDTLEPGFRDREIVEMVREAVATGCYEHLRYKHFGPVSKMINSDFIKNNHFTFDETMANNDAMFSVKTGHYAKKVKVDQSPIYCITCSRASVSHNYSDRVVEDRLYVNQNINYFLRKHHKNEYVINLIPYIYCIHNFHFGSFLKRLKILSMSYYLFYFWRDCFVLIFFQWHKDRKTDKIRRIYVSKKLM